MKVLLLKTVFGLFVLLLWNADSQAQQKQDFSGQFPKIMAHSAPHGTAAPSNLFAKVKAKLINFILEQKANNELKDKHLYPEILQTIESKRPTKQAQKKVKRKVKKPRFRPLRMPKIGVISPRF